MRKKTKKYAKVQLLEAGNINDKTLSPIENVTIKAVGLGIILLVVLEIFYIKITHGATFYPVIDFFLSIAVILTVAVFFIIQGKQAEEAVKNSDEQFRDLFENANELIQSVDIDGNFVFVNRKWQEVLGYSNDEVQRLKLGEILREDEISHCMEFFKRVCAGEVLDDVETVFVTKDGNEIIVQGNVNAKFKNGKFVATRGIFHDVSERKKMEKILRESVEKYRLITESSSDLISKVDLEGKYIYASPSHQQLGYTEEDLLGKSGFDFIHPEDVEVLMKIFVESLQDPEGAISKTLEFRIRESSGKWQYLESTANFIFNNRNEPDSILLVSKNVTERKEAEKEVIKIVKELEQKNLELERFNKIAIGRELRMIEFKQEINDLLLLAGHPQKYMIPNIEKLKNISGGSTSSS